MQKGIKILIGILALVILAFIIFFGLKGSPDDSYKQNSYLVNYSYEYLTSTSDISGFEYKKIGSGFVIYYHNDSEINANKALAILEQRGVDLYRRYLGIEPKDIPVFLTTDIDEYVRVAEFPGGKENVQVGDGSAPNGKIYIYKPFEESDHDKTEGMIIHEGVHAVLYQFFGPYNMKNLPGFLNEGFAHYIEFVLKAGPDFNPLDQIYHSDLLVSSIQTGSPKLLSLDELGEKCEGYIAEEELNFLCRAQGTFTIWHINKNYDQETLQNFLIDLKESKDWKESLSNATGKTTSQFGEEIREQLKQIINKK